MFDGYDGRFDLLTGRFDLLMWAGRIIWMLCAWSLSLILDWIFGPVSTGLLIFISFWVALPITQIVLELLLRLWNRFHPGPPISTKNRY